MILIDNRSVLRTKNRELLHKISQWDDQPSSGTVEVEKSKSGVPTIKVQIEGKTQYLQSKYDPVREAERFVDKYIADSHHVLFIGVGMGYHINYFMKKHPDTKFSIYEPNEEVLHAYLSNFSLNELPLQQLKSIFAGIDEKEIMNEIQNILLQANNVLQIIPLPVYEKNYGAQIKNLLEKTLEAVKDRHSTILTNVAFQKRWTINSIKNFPALVKTPNILHDIDRSAFAGRPAIIVAAGPSLNDEFENLRYIKEHGLAYIFSVGSAINSLIEHGIYPDAACTYDPQDINYRVIQRIKDDNITEIPLVFGSSVGFETIENYPGSLLHMIVSQDTISPALLSHTKQSEIDFVNDAPSIAVVTFQLLAKLGVDEIILVGQNLAYIDNQHYAKGIDYGTGNQTVSEERMQSALLIEDVNGNKVKTTEGFNRMRQELEMYIARYPEVKVWNTTKAGAVIQGTKFEGLQDLISNQLKEKICQKDWMVGHSHYDIQHLNLQLNMMNKQSKLLGETLNKVMGSIQSIQQAISHKRLGTLEKHYNKLDEEIGKMKRNLFYQVFLEPMIRVQQEGLSQNIKDIKYETNEMKKAENIVREFGSFLSECIRDYHFVIHLFEEMKEEVNPILN